MSVRKRAVSAGSRQRQCSSTSSSSVHPTAPASLPSALLPSPASSAAEVPLVLMLFAGHVASPAQPKLSGVRVWENLAGIA